MEMLVSDVFHVDGNGNDESWACKNVEFKKYDALSEKDLYTN
jgi:hypothetical protein